MKSPSAQFATLAVRVTPRSRRPGVSGARDGAVLVAVAAPPDRGRATEEARLVVAEWLGVAPSRVALAAGATSRSKRFRIAGWTGADLRKRLVERLGSSAPGVG
jgi:hypothetical protein